MKGAIVSNRVGLDFDVNQNRILELAAKSVDAGAEFILFPEAAATGLVNTGNPETDRRIAETIPGPRNTEWRDFASEHGVYFGAGLLEREGDSIFDSAVLYNPEGELILHYRRNDPGWHSVDDDPSVYCEETQVPVVDSPIGRLAFLICGDLWNDEVLERLKNKKPDYLLYLFARDIEPKERIESIWMVEVQAYRERWKESGSNVLVVNLLCDRQGFESIGGAWFVDNRGKLVAVSPILQENILFVDL
ncbi:carbon-nitrogen hydrolase family protein [Candidatus Thorarchaeota archaeon]|nr:MAG: carbon-nitrogen hydrolase family protein [Candidatus Thorarchaeota archaeon]